MQKHKKSRQKHYLNLKAPSNNVKMQSDKTLLQKFKNIQILCKNTKLLKTLKSLVFIWILCIFNSIFIYTIAAKIILKE